MKRKFKVTVVRSYLDLTAPKEVEILIRYDGTVVWVNVDGTCRFRACRIGKLVVDDKRRKEPE